MAINRKVLDVSKYQPTINYAATAKDIDGVILRCGITYWGAQNKDVDSCFEKHYAGFKAQGVPVGVYYYSAADSVAQAKLEAQKCLEIIKGKQLEYPVYFDMENNERQGNLSGAQRYEIADAFLSTVEAAGYFVGFYSYSAFIQKIGTDYFNKLKTKYSIWLADYRKTPASYTRDMWQYTSSGSVAGISGRVDLSHCYRDFPTIIKNAGLNGFTKTAAAKPVETVKPVTDTLKVGDTVKVLKAIQYDNGKSFRTWFATYTVKQIKGNRVVIAKAGITVAAVHKDNLKKV